MSLTIDLDPTDEARLAAAAKQEGLAPAELVRRVLAEHLPPLAEGAPEEDPTLALFRQWGAEDRKRTPDEVSKENELWERFQANLNETRQALGMRQL